jgi:hypothetical protein
MQKIGVMLSDLGASQLSFNVVTKLNEECEKSNNDFVAFVENITSHIISPNFAIMGINEIWSFDGALIATSASTALHLSKATNPANKFFYVWDLEWMRPHGKDFQYMVKAYNNPSVNLIARSSEHSLAIRNYSNRDVCGVVEDFNIKQLYEVINNVYN